MTKFTFGNIVVVDGNLVGVVVKSWGASLTGSKRGVHHEVYVRSYNGIKEYDEQDITHFVYDKELSDEATVSGYVMRDYKEDMQAIYKGDIARAIGHMQGCGHPDQYLENKYPEFTPQKEEDK